MTFIVLTDDEIGDLTDVGINKSICKRHPDIRLSGKVEKPNPRDGFLYYEVRNTGILPLQADFSFFKSGSEPFVIRMHLVSNDIRRMDSVQKSGCFTNIQKGWSDGQVPEIGTRIIETDYSDGGGRYVFTGVRYENTYADMISVLFETEPLQTGNKPSTILSTVVPSGKTVDLGVYDKGKERTLPIVAFIQNGTWRPTEWGGRP